jgi:hypothetical protein
MIAIVNMGPTNAEQGTDGWHHYEVRINREVICAFKHYRSDGLAHCLELAAEAVRKEREAGNP